MASIDAHVDHIVCPIITKLLGEHSSLVGWIREFHGGGLSDLEIASQKVRMQTTRHAWVDHLIKHYESIGD